MLNKDRLNKFNHKLPIKSVTVGPGLDQDIKEEGLKTFLERKGYSEVEIKNLKFHIEICKWIQNTKVMYKIKSDCLYILILIKYGLFICGHQIIVRV